MRLFCLWRVLYQTNQQGLGLEQSVVGGVGFARVSELVDETDLKSVACNGRKGSIPFPGTKQREIKLQLKDSLMNFNFLPAAISNDAKSQTAAKVVTVVGGLAAAWLLAPMIFLALGGVVGAVVAVAVGYTSIKFAPFFGVKVSNLALRALKWEARTNPIETKENIYQQRADEVNESDKLLLEFNGKVEHYRTQVVALKKKYPAEAAEFEKHLQAMEVLLSHRYKALEQARRDLKAFYEVIQRDRAIWEMTKASDSMDKAAGILTEKDARRKILENEASLAIEAGMARSFASLNHAFRTEMPMEPPALTHSEPQVLEIGKQGVYEAVKR